MKRSPTRLALGLLGATGLAFAADAATPRNALVMAWNIDAISTWDPAQIGEVVTNELIQNTCDALVRHDMDDEAAVVPAVAERWSVSDDGLEIRFDLRRDAVFPSGNPVTAHDAAWSLQRVVQLGFGNAATMTEYGFTAEGAAEQIQAIDDHTLQLSLDKPYPIGLVLQAIGANRVAAVLDRETIMANEVDGDLGNSYLTTRTECVGPYRLRQWDASEVIVLEANDTYYDEAPKLPRIIIRHVAEAGTQRLMLERGDIDIGRNLTSEDLRALEGSDAIRLETVLNHQLFYVGMNAGRAPFDDDRVRLAFRYLIDYDQLGSTVMAYDGVPRASVVPIGAFGALDENEGQPFSLDVDRARELLAEAGYPDGFSTRIFIGTQPYAAPVAQHLQQNARQAGITIEIEQMASAQLFSRFRSRDFDTTMLAWQTSVPHAHGMLSRHAVNPDNSPDFPGGMYPTWRAAWYSEDFNRMVDEALFERDEATQIELYHELQRAHMERGPFAYMFQMSNTAAVRNEVENWRWHAFRVFLPAVDKS